MVHHRTRWAIYVCFVGLDAEIRKSEWMVMNGWMSLLKGGHVAV